MLRNLFLLAVVVFVTGCNILFLYVDTNVYQTEKTHTPVGVVTRITPNTNTPTFTPTDGYTLVPSLTATIYTPTPSPVPENTSTPMITQVGYVLGNSNINLRQGPSTNTPVLTTIVVNTSFNILSQNGEWYYVSYNKNNVNYRGYVFSPLIRIENIVVTPTPTRFLEPTPTPEIIYSIPQNGTPVYSRWGDKTSFMYDENGNMVVLKPYDENGNKVNIKILAIQVVRDNNFTDEYWLLVCKTSSYQHNDCLSGWYWVIL